MGTQCGCVARMPGSCRMRARADIQHSGLLFSGVAGVHRYWDCAGCLGEFDLDAHEDGPSTGVAYAGLSVHGCAFFVYALADFFQLTE